MKHYSTKRALIASFIVLAICFSTLVGTTYAWFTDSVSSSGNVIQSGNLDVKLLMHNKTEYVDISEAGAPIFGGDENTPSLIDEWYGTDVLWEPGKTQIVYLAVENAGSLALKYNIIIDVVDNGLVGSLDYAILDGVKAGDLTPGSWDDICNVSGAQVGLIAEGRTVAAENGAIVAGADARDYFALAIHMQEEAGNNYQDKNIVIDINIVATQLANESDSFGDDYDEDAPLEAPAIAVSSLEDFFDAIDNGYDMLLAKPIVVNADFVDEMNEHYSDTTYALGGRTTVIDDNVVINGNGSTIYRTEETKSSALFTVADGYTLTLADITLDGGAVWTGDIDPVLLRGTVNSGMVTTGALVATNKGDIVLEEGAVVQNNDGASAIYIGTRAGGSLTVTGAQIINNASGTGAIWGGGDITVNEGAKINGNASTYYGGVVRFVGGNITFTMNGGEMNHNYTTSSGGALGGGGKSGSYGNAFILNGGEMAYNACGEGGAGGAIYTNEHARVTISGDFTMHDNTCGSGLGNAIRFAKYSSLTMTGGNIYNNGDSAFWSYWTGINITGGVLDNDGEFYIALNAEPTVGGGDIKDTYHFDLGIVRNTVNLVENFGTFNFVVNENVSHFSNFNFKPAADYVYTEGDEAKLVCMNEGYSTYWDASTSTFRLQAE